MATKTDSATALPMLRAKQIDEELKYFGYSYRYRSGQNEVGYSELVEAWNRENFGRADGKIDQSIVRDYSLRATQTPAPSPVLVGTENGFYVVDGVHRLLGRLEAGAATFSAYVISGDLDESERLLLRATLNEMWGDPGDRKTRRRNAIRMGIDFGWADAVLAKRLHATKEEITEEREFLETGFLIRQVTSGAAAEYATNKGFCQSLRLYFTAEDWEKAPAAMGRLVSLVSRCKMNNGQSEPWLKEIGTKVRRGRAKSRHEEISRLLDAVEREPEVQEMLKGPKYKRTKVEMAVGGLKGACTHLMNLIESDERPSPAIHHEMQKAYKEAGRLLQTVRTSRN